MLIVRVSPFYTGRGWVDRLSGVEFRKEYNNITIPSFKDIDRIERDIIHNVLIVVQGSVEEYKKEKIKEADLITPEVEIPALEEVEIETTTAKEEKPPKNKKPKKE